MDGQSTLWNKQKHPWKKPAFANGIRLYAITFHFITATSDFSTENSVPKATQATVFLWLSKSKEGYEEV